MAEEGPLGRAVFLLAELRDAKRLVSHLSPQHPTCSSFDRLVAVHRTVRHGDGAVLRIMDALTHEHPAFDDDVEEDLGGHLRCGLFRRPERARLFSSLELRKLAVYADEPGIHLEGVHLADGFVEGFFVCLPELGNLVAVRTEWDHALSVRALSPAGKEAFGRADRQQLLLGLFLFFLGEWFPERFASRLLLWVELATQHNRSLGAHCFAGG